MKDITDFMLEEYKNISSAFFDISSKVVSFFKYILIIYSVPIIALNEPISTISRIKRSDINPIIFIGISIIGLFVLMYIIKLRNEALLYARTINGVRRFFYDQELMKMDDDEKIMFTNNFNILPTQKEKPSFTDKQFLWIVRTLSVINSFYLFIGLVEWKNNLTVTLYLINNLFISANINITKIIKFIVSLPIFNLIYSFIRSIALSIKLDLFTFHYIIPIVLFWLWFHFYLYRYYIKKAEIGSDFYSHTIGIDIDGVLNEHEQHFCKVYNENNEISITSDEITKMPVNECIPSVTKSSERKVFLEKSYWQEMPVKENASNTIDELITKLGYKINIFTWREWGFNNLWAIKFLNANFVNKIRYFLPYYYYEIFKKGRKFNIRKITRDWLNNNNIKFHKLTFEQGNLHHQVSSKKYKYKNRFYLSKERKIKFFVEDNPEKAFVLSNICNIVFLMNHKYNEHSYNETIPKDLPHNIIRVDDWISIYNHLNKIG